MACADVDMEIHGAAEEPGGADRGQPAEIWSYRASEVVPKPRGPLHDLLQKQPAEFGSLQIMSGLVSVGLGIIFAVEQQMQLSLITLFRVSPFCGLLFIIAGLISFLLFKYPQLLQVSLMVNCGCIVVAIIAVCLISVDLADRSAWRGGETFLQLEWLELCLLVFKVMLSAIFCLCFFKEKRSKSSSSHLQISTSGER